MVKQRYWHLPKYISNRDSGNTLHKSQKFNGVGIKIGHNRLGATTVFRGHNTGIANVTIVSEILIKHRISRAYGRRGCQLFYQ
jgi:hypothetical protein